MKKRLSILIICIALSLSSICVNTAKAASSNPSFKLLVNEHTIAYPSIASGGVYYVPVRAVFEKLGAFVFYRTRDRQIYALSRDGDTFQHIIGTNTVTVNGQQKTFKKPSFTQNNITYIPIDMVTVLHIDSISCNNGVVSIQKKFTYTQNNKLVNDVLCACRNSNFYPERFKRYLNYHTQKPASTMQDVIFMVNLGLDFPFYSNVATISDPYSLTVLVNKYNKLPSGFVQKNLVNMDKKYTINDGKQYLMVDVAYQNFVQMAEDAKKDGLTLKAVSTYRTEDYQARLYNSKVNSTGQRNADNYSARPGFSEHQTGLAVDINSTGTSFERTNEFKWLQQHAHKYGFIMRYPKNKTWITGYAYEPWHYRYVGLRAAKTIHREGSTYEQYYIKYVDVNEFK